MLFPVPPRSRRCAAFAAVALLAWTLAPAPARAGARDGRLDLYWIDSEGGGSTLIVTPSGESVLIDAGNPGGRDPGRIHKVATEVAGLTRLDHLVVTHFHIDHFGGAAELAGLMPIRHVWDNGMPDADPDGNRQSTWPLTSKPYREMKVEARHVVRPGTTLPLVVAPGAPPLELRCLLARQQVWDSALHRPPPPEAGEPRLKSPDASDNANSSAWVLSLGDFRFFDAGDLTWNVETKLVWPMIRVPEVDVLQVTHHGLEVSNHPRLLQALNPTVSVMNNGPTKGGMGEVLASLRALPRLQAQYQVHRNVRPDGATNNCPEAFIANHARECRGDFVHASVAPDGKSFVISIPARDHRATYATRPKP